jgi:hypothetical protein
MTQQKKSPVQQSRPSVQHQLVLDPIHFSWRNGTVLCGREPNARTLAYHQWSESMTRWPEACQACVTIYQHPSAVPAARTLGLPLDE